jgi:hypothetical protein
MKYFHELTQEEINQLIEQGKTWGYILENFKQPNWCNYPEALGGEFGCWSLIDLRENGKRKEISKEFCSKCSSFKKI